MIVDYPEEYDKVREEREMSDPNPTSIPSRSFDTAFKGPGFDKEVQSILDEIRDDSGDFNVKGDSEYSNAKGDSEYSNAKGDSEYSDTKEEPTIPVERREDYVFDCPPDGRSIMCQLGDVDTMPP